MATTWSTTDNAGNGTTETLSNGNLTVAFGGNGSFYAGVRSTTSHNSGKWFFEITVTTFNSDFNLNLGIGPSTANLGAECGDDGTSIVVRPPYSDVQDFNSGANGDLSQNSGGSSTPANGDVYSFAVDMDAQSFWCTSPNMRASGATWNSRTTGNPATNANPNSFSGMAMPAFILAQGYNGAVVTLNTTGPFNQTVPSGFNAWDFLGLFPPFPHPPLAGLFS